MQDGSAQFCPRFRQHHKKRKKRPTKKLRNPNSGAQLAVHYYIISCCNVSVVVSCTYYVQSSDILCNITHIDASFFANNFFRHYNEINKIHALEGENVMEINI